MADSKTELVELLRRWIDEDDSTDPRALIAEAAALLAASPSISSPSDQVEIGNG